jgi:hypothetical protein
VRSSAEDNPPQAIARNPYPHPLEERSYFAAITVCRHCWAIVDLSAISESREEPEPCKEGTTIGTHAAPASGAPSLYGPTLATPTDLAKETLSDDCHWAGTRTTRAFCRLDHAFCPVAAALSSGFEPPVCANLRRLPSVRTFLSSTVMDVQIRMTGRCCADFHLSTTLLGPKFALR